MEEDWPLLLSFLPINWIELATQTNALKHLRKDKDAEYYLRTLLLHVGCGYSMRETTARAKLAGIADISDVAFMGRLQKAKDWLHNLCVALFNDQGFDLGEGGDKFQVRLFDATLVKEPGPTGSLWRIHYSVQLPSLACDFFKITATKGKGTGESFFHFPIKKGDHIIADRGYASCAGVHHIASKKAHVIVRVNTSTLVILNGQARPFGLLEQISAIQTAGQVASWNVLIPTTSGAHVAGRICAIRKSTEAISIAHKKLKENASKKGHAIKPETLEFAKYVIVFTTFEEDRFSDVEILNWYRCRWQVELVFKRFKSIAQLGHLPKRSDDSAKAWLYGKLFVALLTQKLIHHATFFSPWGYALHEPEGVQRLA